MKQLSLRRRLVLGMIAVMAVGLLAADVAGLLLFRSFQIDRLDETLLLPFRDRDSPQVLERLATNCDPDKVAGGLWLPTTYAIVILDQQGRQRCSVPDPDAARAGSPVVDLTPEELSALVDGQRVVGLPDRWGRAPWRARVIGVTGGYAVLAVSTTEVNDTVARLTLVSLGVGLATVTLAGLASAGLVRLALRPLTQIEATAGAIAAGDLSRRVPGEDPDTEVGRLATSLNAMLAQIEEAFAARDETEERLRRFVADASHELRTPLTTIRGNAELVRQGAVNAPADVARTIERIEAESVRLGRLVDDLLAMARLDEAAELQLQQVDLLNVVADVVADARVRAPERMVRIQYLTDSPWSDSVPVMHGEETLLRQVLTNLVSNALNHTPADTEVEVALGVREEQVVVSVIDHGPGLQAGNEQRVFERFFREDAGRSRTRGGGSGLGLAIAAAMVARHAGTLRYEPTPDGGATFVASFPVR